MYRIGVWPVSKHSAWMGISECPSTSPLMGAWWLFSKALSCSYVMSYQALLLHNKVFISMDFLNMSSEAIHQRPNGASLIIASISLTLPHSLDSLLARFGFGVPFWCSISPKDFSDLLSAIFAPCTLRVGHSMLYFPVWILWHMFC